MLLVSITDLIKARLSLLEELVINILLDVNIHFKKIIDFGSMPLSSLIIHHSFSSKILS